MRPIVLATNNAHKAHEFRSIFALLGASCELIRPGDLGLRWDTSEDGETFADNARQKAMSLAALLRGEVRPGTSTDVTPTDVPGLVARSLKTAPLVLADDSGLSVAALGGAPGVYSARFGASDGVSDDRGRAEYLLRRLGDHGDRRAHYTCNVAIVDPTTPMMRWLQAEAHWYGTIAPDYRAGGTGFGYDPIFIPDGGSATVSHMAEEQKHRESHRALAAGLIEPVLTRL